MKISTLLDKVDPSVAAKVRTAKRDWNTTIRAHIRDETRMNLRKRGSSIQVRVDVEAGYPHVLSELEVSGIDWNAEHLVAIRHEMECYLKDSRTIRKRILTLPMNEVERNHKFGKDLESLEGSENLVREMLAFALQATILRKILEIDEDILGDYSSEEGQGRVRLYWAVIGLVSQSLGVSPESLAIVILTHELSHAYTHLGHDADGNAWPDFFRESRKLTEGLAQYYTHETVNKLKPKGGDLRPLEAYKRMLSLQPEAYTHHLEWAAAWHPEVVRSAMIQARNHGNISREKFEDLMATEAKRLKVERGLFRAFPALKKSGNPAPGALSRLDP